MNASPAHVGTTFPLISDPKCAKVQYNNQLRKRDGSVFVRTEGYYHIATVVTSSSNSFNLIVDTGSSYTWVGANVENLYVAGYGSHPTPQFVNIKYGGGMVHLRANTYRDIIVLDGWTINPQEIGIPTQLSGFPPDIDGILGLGPSGLSADYTEDGSIIPTVVDNLYSQGTISSAALGVYFVPRNVENVGGGGLLSFGSIDTSVLTSDVRYVPITQSPPASTFWGVDGSVAYDNMPILGPASGILDSGSRRILITRDAFINYQSATSAVIDSSDRNRRLTITQSQYGSLQTLSILIGDQSYDLSPNAQIYPRSSSDQRIFLVVQMLSSSPGIAFKLGSPFLYAFAQCLVGVC
ncbi:hypothetical protein ID866_10009 [Astraeus odoratus]|nr:hypothetical protein ID866_10009 [Astraeus odoratus]